MQVIKVYYPKGTNPQHLTEIISKSVGVEHQIDPQESFEDPILTDIAKQIVGAHDTLYASMLQEISAVLDREYTGG